MRDENEHFEGDAPGEENPNGEQGHADGQVDGQAGGELEEGGARPTRRRRGRRSPVPETTTEEARAEGADAGSFAPGEDPDEEARREPAAVSRAPRFAEEGGPSRPILGGQDGDPGRPPDDDDLDDEVRAAEEGDDGFEPPYTLRDRIADRVYDTREWVSESPRNIALAGVVVVASLVIFLGLGYLIVSSLTGEEPAPVAQRPEGPDGNPGSTPGDSRGLKPAANAGELGVSVNGDGSVDVVHRLGAVEEEWTGDLERRPPPEGSEATGDSAYLELSGTDSEVVFESVLAEDDARSWQGRIRELTPEGNVIVASQISDPGSSALDGRVPVVRGTYVVKGAAGGGTSASGTYEDTLVDESTIERIYSETFVNDEGEGQTRSWRSEHNITGDGGLTPVLVGYEPPAEAQSGTDGG